MKPTKTNPNLRKIVYRNERRSHRFLPSNTINIYVDAHRNAFMWKPNPANPKYDMQVPSNRFLSMLSEKFDKRVQVTPKTGYMQLVFDNEVDYVYFGLTYIAGSVR